MQPTDIRWGGGLPEYLLAKSIKAVASHDLQLVFDDWLRTLKPSTPVRYANALKAFFKWAQRKGYVADSPMEGVDLPKVRALPRNFQPRTVSQILEIADKVGGLYGDTIAILALSGMRWGEARAMHVGDVIIDGMNSCFHVVHSQVEGRSEKLPKSGKARYVPIDPHILERVERLLVGKSPEDYMLSRDGTSQLWRSRFCQTVRWKELFPDMSIHDLRHTAAVNWLRVGIPVNNVQAWLGHSDLKMTSQYTAFLGMDIDGSAYARLWQSMPTSEK